MTPSPPENQDFLSKTIENVKDMPPPLRFGIVFFALFLFAVLGNAVVPDNFVLLVYLLSIGVLVVYIFWEYQQRKDQRLSKKDEFEYDLEKAKLQLQFKDEQDKRKHERELKKLDQQPAPAVTPIPPSPPAEELRPDYLNWVRTQVSELSLLGVDPEATRDEQEGRLHLDRVYTALLTADAEAAGKPEQPELFGRGEKRLSAVAQLNQQSRLVLLGDPGGGKSTFVNYFSHVPRF